MSEAPFVCPHPNCRKTISRARPTDTVPEQCPHCGQPLDAPMQDPYQTTAPPAAASSDPYQTVAPSTQVKPPTPDTDIFLTAALSGAPEPMFVPPEDDIPATLGRFQIRKKLGAGAFGVVYRAYDPQLDREVALKVAKPHAMLSKDSIKGFLREARAAANLRHPNIVPVFDSGQDGEQYFIASAFIPGQTLAHAIAAARGLGLKPRWAAQLVRELAEALAYAHHKAVVHRDIKPANVLLDEQGEPLLADFGLARRDEGEAVRSRFLRHQAEAQEGQAQPGEVPEPFPVGTQLTGTPAYMAPEQAQGQAEAASDQYSLGVVLYELLTGRLPFAGDILEQIEQHKMKAPPSPRAVNPKLPRDLEAITLKCLEKDPARRYASCQKLADDLRRWLEREPVRARRLNLRERLGLWVKKEPKLAAALAAVAAVMTLAIVLLGREQAKTIQAQRDRALAQVDALLDASPQAVPNILHSLEPFRDIVSPRLRELRTQSDLSEQHRTRVSLALLHADPDEVEYLYQRLLEAEPEEVLLIREALVPYRAQLTADFWSLAADTEAAPDRRFRAVVALAAFEPEHPRWVVAAEKIVGHFLTSNPLYLRTWTEALRPVRRSLVPPLARAFRDRSQPERGRVAATILVDYAADQPEFLAELLTEADPGQYALLWPGVHAHRQEAIDVFTRTLDRPMPAEDKLEARDALARRQANAAVAMLQLGHSERVWPLLRHSDDPSRRTYLLHAFGRLGTDPGPLLKRLETESDVSARRALILSLGEFTEAQLPAARRQPVVERLLRWYRDDPDPGIHGAIDWLLYHDRQGPQPRKLDWHQRPALDQIDRELAGQPPGPRRWYVTRDGETMTIVRGPVEFVMGSPAYEPGRVEKNEDQVRKRIPRSFAIAATEVTVAQFRRFADAHPAVKKQHTYTKRFSPDDNGPIISVTWFEAAQYCNWLSEQEGIPKDQWCYPPIEEIKEGMVLPKDYLHRTGYRLPTEAEWEYACRAGARTSRCFGSSDAMLVEYAWYGKNSDDRTWPFRELKPNDLGLYNMHGNVWNWCQDRFRLYEAGDDTEDPNVKVSGEGTRVQRGASFDDDAPSARCADRASYRPSNRDRSVGVRPARTMP